METFCGELRELLEEGNRPVDTILTPPLMNRKQNICRWMGMRIWREVRTGKVGPEDEKRRADLVL